MSRLTYQFGVKIALPENVVSGLLTPPVATRNPLRVCDYCRLTRH